MKKGLFTLFLFGAALAVQAQTNTTSSIPEKNAVIEVPEDLDSIEQEEEIEIGIFKEEDTDSKGPVVFVVVEKQPEFKGGKNALYEYIQAELKYPAPATRMGIEGRVYVQFVITDKGEVTEVQAVKGIGAGCDEEAVRIIKATSGKWNAGSQRGRPVYVRMVLPINFKLEEKK